MPIQGDDAVQVAWGHRKGQQAGKAVPAYRKSRVIHTEWVPQEEAKGTTIHVGSSLQVGIIGGGPQKAPQTESQSTQAGKEKGTHMADMTEKMQEWCPQTHGYH